MDLGLKVITAVHQKRLMNIDLNNIHAQMESNVVFFTFREHYLDLATHEMSLKEIDTRIQHYSHKLSFPITSYSDYFNGIYQACKTIVEGWELLLSQTEVG